MRLSNLKKAIHLMIMGPPGSGKGTVSSRIVQDFGMDHLSSGNVLHNQIAQHTTHGQLAASYVKSGRLVPDAVIVELMLFYIQRIPHSKSWLLDGFPRNLSQAKSIFKSVRLDAVINLNVPFLTIQERLSGRWIHLPSGRVYNDSFNPPRIPEVDDVTGEYLVQRDDDKPETILKRLETYQKETAPLLNFYRDKNLLHSYSGTKTDDLWPSIKMLIKNLLTEENKRAPKNM